MKLSEALLAEGGALAACVDPQASLESGAPRLAAAGPRAAGARPEYELLMEMILEGSRLHYGPQRVVRTPDADLALLLGDQLYALGLSRLAALGDIEAVAELADLISLIAQAHAAEDRVLADAVWEAGAVAIGWGRSDRHRAAKELARTGAPDAAAELVSAAANARGGR